MGVSTPYTDLKRVRCQRLVDRHDYVYFWVSLYPVEHGGHITPLNVIYWGAVLDVPVKIRQFICACFGICLPA